jgi:hypothetical protein
LSLEPPLTGNKESVFSDAGRQSDFSDLHPSNAPAQIVSMFAPDSKTKEERPEQQ